MQIELGIFGPGGHSDAKTDQVCFCPFCGAKIEIKETHSVILKPKYKSVPDGYKEEARTK